MGIAIAISRCMKTLVVLSIYIGLGAGTAAHADHNADSSTSTNSANVTTGSAGSNDSASASDYARGDTQLMTPEMAQSLWGQGSIPRVSHLNQMYGQVRGRSDEVCANNFRVIQARQKSLYATQVPRPLSVLEGAAAKFGISKKLVDKTLAVFLQNQTAIPNQRFVSIFDLSKPATAKRFVVIDTWTGTAKAYRSSHGKGSDPKHTGYATRFGNDPSGSTYKSSLGCALAGQEYHARHTRQEPKGRVALTLLGFSPTNDKVCSRGIYMHAAPYVNYEKGVVNSTRDFANHPGRSWGCPAFTYADRDEVFKQIDGGGLVCSWDK
jgi:hypothetical protein